MTTVYRVQEKHNKRLGVYQGNIKVVEKLLTRHTDFEGVNARHPTPFNDSGIARRAKAHEYCGFISMTDLFKWFGGFIPELLKSGFEIAVLNDVIVTAIGEYQVLFKWSK